MTRSDLATVRSLAASPSTVGNPVVSSRPPSVGEFCSDWRIADTSRAIAVRSVSENRAISGCAIQEPRSTLSGPAKADWLTTSGPYVVKPPEVLTPEDPTTLSSQYEA